MPVNAAELSCATQLLVMPVSSEPEDALARLGAHRPQEPLQLGRVCLSHCKSLLSQYSTAGQMHELWMRHEGLTRQRQAALPGKQSVRTVGNSAVCMDKVFQSHGGTVGVVVPISTGCVHK
jgi:hypothetical protein